MKLSILLLFCIHYALSFMPCIHDSMMYRKYLVRLRQTHRLINGNIQSFVSINDHSHGLLNNTDVQVKNIIMGNLILDVSTVKEIHIKTHKDKLIIHLDSKKDTLPYIMNNINNVDSLINILSILSKITNTN